MAAMRVLRLIARALAWIAAVLCAAWAFGALFFDFPVVTLRAPTAIVFVLVLIGVVIWLPGKLLKLVAVFGGFGLVTSWWLILKPTNGNTTGFQT